MFLPQIIENSTKLVTLNCIYDDKTQIRCMQINEKPQSRNGTVATMMRGRSIYQGTHV